LEECEKRNSKGLYARARRGELKNFTGVSDPYETPEHPEFIAKTEEHTPEELVDAIIEYLYERGVLVRR
jgi:adenylylsulfate kinase-like enzyme